MPSKAGGWVRKGLDPVRYEQARVFFLLLSVLLLSGAAGGKAQRIPEPVAQWSRGTGDRAKGVPNASYQSLMATPHVLLVASRGAYGIAAFDRPTGHELWSKVAFVKAADYHGILDYEQWRPIGTASDQAGQEIAILWHLRSKATPDTADPIQLHFQVEHDLQAVEAGTGKLLWQEDLPAATGSLQPELTPVGVYGGILLLVNGGPAPRAEFCDAATGARLDPASTAGREAMMRAAARQGASLLPISLPGHPSLLDLRTGRLVPLALHPTAPGTRLPQSIQVYCMAGRIVAYVDTDDGGVGHSPWPKYLWCGDRSGHKLWQFPTTITYRDRSQLEAADASWLVRALPVSGGIILTEDIRGALYGIEAGNGKLLWRRRLAGMPIDMAAFEEGALARTRPLNSSGSRQPADILEFVNARSGRARLLARVAPGDALLVNGHQLFLLDERGTLRTYALGRVSAKPAQVRRKPYLSPAVIHKTLNRYLALAVRQDDLDGVQVLLNKGADPNTHAAYEYPLLFLAITLILEGRGRREIVHALLEGGADANARIRKPLLLTKGSIVNDIANYPVGTTALMAAVSRQSDSPGSQLDVVKLLLRYGADPRLRNQDNKTALTLAEALPDKENAADIIKVLKR